MTVRILPPSGITEDPADVPGPYGVYLPATTHTLQRTTTSGSGPIIETQDWVFAAATGERLEMHITFERGVGSRRPASAVEGAFATLSTSLS